MNNAALFVCINAFTSDRARTTPKDEKRSGADAIRTITTRRRCRNLGVDRKGTLSDIRLSRQLLK